MTTFGPASCLKKPGPGTRVRLSAYFMKNVPNAAQGRWHVLTCACKLCRLGNHVAVNEPPPYLPFLDDGVPPEQRPKWRHINWKNLEIVYDPIDSAPETPRKP